MRAYRVTILAYRHGPLVSERRFYADYLSEVIPSGYRWLIDTIRLQHMSRHAAWWQIWAEEPGCPRCLLWEKSFAATAVAMLRRPPEDHTIDPGVRS